MILSLESAISRSRAILSSRSTRASRETKALTITLGVFAASPIFLVCSHDRHPSPYITSGARFVSRSLHSSGDGAVHSKRTLLSRSLTLTRNILSSPDPPFTVPPDGSTPPPQPSMAVLWRITTRLRPSSRSACIDGAGR